MKIVLLGPQGSGKGTQGKMLAEKLGVPHVSTGELLREITAGDSPEGKEIKEIMDSGRLVSDKTLLQVLGKRFERPDCVHGWILDGTPRNVEQMKILESEIGVDKAVLIDVTEEETFARIQKRQELEGRSDDTPESLRKRLSTYYEKTMPVVEQYRSEGKLVDVNGMQDIDAVYVEMCEKLGV